MVRSQNLSMNNIIDLKPEANLTFNSFTIGLQNNKYLFSKVNGELVNSKFNPGQKIFISAYKGQNIKINGEFKNLPEWLSGRPVKMTATADVSFDKLIPEAFF